MHAHEHSHTTWHGTAGQYERLTRILDRACCQIGPVHARSLTAPSAPHIPQDRTYAQPMPCVLRPPHRAQQLCTAHDMLLHDQRALDGLLAILHNRQRYIAEEHTTARWTLGQSVLVLPTRTP